TLRTRLAAIPGVRGATLSGFPLLSGAMSLSAIQGSPSSRGREGDTAILPVGPGFFSTLQIPILLGREIDERDIRSAAPVAVVNELFVKTHFGKAYPIGRRFRFAESNSPEIEIVGVSKNARYNSLKREIPVTVYVPYENPRQITYELRTAGNPLVVG